MSSLLPPIEIHSPRPVDPDDADMIEDSDDDTDDLGMPSSRPRRFKDPINDYISISDPMVLAFIDSPQFQRLRYIKQLGTSYFVWLGASHNRFEHSIGVCHLAGLLVERLRAQQSKLNITDRDVRCVRLAGLCHDLGHGPFSHVWDSQFMPRSLGREWCHEQGSEMMLDALIKDNNIDIPDEDVEFIKALIVGDPQRCANEKPFLFQIVANKINGIDVDKFDYIYRDTYSLGVKCTLDAHRLINSCRVIKNTLCFNHNDLYSVYELFYSRYSLHKRIYNHKAAKAIEWMVVDALLKADPYLKLTEKTLKPETYLYLTDSIVEEIERSTVPQLEESRQIIKRLRLRDIYKVVDHRTVTTEYYESWKRTELLTPHSIARKAKELKLPGWEKLIPDDIIVDWTSIHFGMKYEDPIRLVRFYSWRMPKRATRSQTEWESYVRPEEWQEFLLRCITRDPSKFGLVQAAYRAIVKSLPIPPNPEPFKQLPPRPVSPSPRRMHQASTSISSVTTEEQEAMVGGPPASSATVRAVTPVGENPFTSVRATYSLQSPMDSPIRRRKRDEDMPNEGEPEEPAGSGGGMPDKKKRKKE